MNTQRLTLDLDKSSVPRGRVTIAQCDHDGTTVEAEIYDNGIAISTSGLSAYLVMRLPDGRHYYRVPATLDGHVATALMDEAYAATVAGTTEIAYFELVGSGATYSTSRFGVRVLPSATADATVPETWDGEVERLIQQLDDAIETATDAASVANAAAANADATADGVESRVQEMAQDAAETATADAEQRIQDAIDAMGDISELAVPLMSADVRGGAKLEEHGGLVLRDEKLGIGSLVQESDGYARGGLAEVTAKGHAEQVATTGKNLLPNTATSQTINGVTFTVNADGSITANGTATDLAQLSVGTRSFDAKVYYCISGCPNGGSTSTYYIHQYGGNFDDIGSGCVFWYNYTTSQGTVIRIASGYTCNNLTFYPMIEAGSTKTSYEPYTGAAPSPSPDWEQPIEVVTGHTVTGKTGRFVDLEVRDANDQLLSTTPIPLPSRGWVGSLPDGTADVLRLDGAGKVEWELKDEEMVLDGDETWAIDNSGARARTNVENLKPIPLNSSIISAYSSHFIPVNVGTTWNALSVGFSGVATLSQIAFTDGTGSMTLDAWKTWLSQNPVTVLYPLATPVTEELGYIDLPSINGECQISIPELDALGVRYFVDDSAGTLARQWAARLESQLGDAIVELAARVAALES